MSVCLILIATFGFAGCGSTAEPVLVWGNSFKYSGEIVDNWDMSNTQDGISYGKFLEEQYKAGNLQLGSTTCTNAFFEDAYTDLSDVASFTELKQEIYEQVRFSIDLAYSKYTITFSDKADSKVTFSQDGADDIVRDLEKTEVPGATENIYTIKGNTSSATFSEKAPHNGKNYVLSFTFPTDIVAGSTFNVQIPTKEIVDNPLTSTGNLPNGTPYTYINLTFTPLFTLIDNAKNTK